MAPSVSLLYILFTVGFLSDYSTSISQLELGVRFLEEPKDVIGVKGKSLALPCKASRTNDQNDFLEIKWYHNDKLMDIANDRRRTIFQNGTLYFTKLVHKKTGHSDQGEYRCVIVKENGSLSSRPGFLRISVLPNNFLSHPMGQNVEIGSNVRLSCEIDFFSELEIEWGKNDEKLPQNDLKYATISGPSVHGSILYIFNVLPDDSGSYKCTAKNILLNKQRHSSSGLLTVLSRVGKNGHSRNSLTFLSAQRPLSSSFFASVREIKEGDNVTLDCVANGSPPPILVWNFLPHGQINPKPIFNKTNAGYNILRIKNITRHQAGWYICSAMNSSTKEITTEVKILTAPEIREKSENIVFRASKTVRFRCVASGNPIPELYWLKDGNLFNITGRIKHRTSVNESQQLRLSELILSSTVTSDAGIYQCMANNSVGSTWAASRLFLNSTQPAPEAPEKVFCESISSTQIKLTWDVPNKTDKIKAFSVHYHLTENGEEMQKVLGSDSRSTEIDKLLPFTNYTFYVRLYIESASEFSEKTICQTGEEVPVETPKTKLKIISPDSVHVSWLPLPKEKARGIINQYKIQWRIKGSPSSRVEQVSNDVLDYTITGLNPGNKYDVRILAATSKGWPNSDLPWETLEVPLNFNKNLPSAPKVNLRAINLSSIEVKWSLPSRSKEVIGYKIFYRKHNSNRIGPIIVPPEIKEYILKGLDPETWYEVMVLGFTKLDDGETGISSVHTLSREGSSKHSPFDFSSVLEPPFSLEADPISPVAINLSWSSSQVASGSCKINYYTVCFSPVQYNRNKNSTMSCVISSENKILIKGLNPFTLYEFKVKSHDQNNKQSAFSQAVECYTLEDVPSSVRDISWKALNKTTVEVSWKEPRQCNGVIKSYILSYSEDPTLPLNLWNMRILSKSDTKIELTDLSSNVKYYLIIRASTNAGFGSYGPPQQFMIPSPTSVSRDEFSPKASRKKQSDHYIGIMVGLGIGICCIILCTTCILCRRRCLKRHISQEFEISCSRHGSGAECRRDREIVMESREPEYFTFLSSQRDRFNSLGSTLHHLDPKNHYPNGTTNGIRKSLLCERRALNENGNAVKYITENFTYDLNCSDSPLLSPKNYSNTTLRESETVEQFKFTENRNNSNKSLRNGKKKSSDLIKPFALSSNNNNNNNNNNNCVSEDGTKEKKTCLGNAELRPFIQNRDETRRSLESEASFALNNNNCSHEDGGEKKKRSQGNGEPEVFSASQGSVVSPNSIDQNDVKKFSEDDKWSDLNSILKNPDFRFSDCETVMKKKNGFALPGNFYYPTFETDNFKDKLPPKETKTLKVIKL